MTYQLTPEFIAGKWRRFWILNALFFSVVVIFMSALMYRASVPGLRVCEVFVILLAFWAPIVALVARDKKRKFDGGLEVLSDRLRFSASSNPLEINFKDITQVGIVSQGEVFSILIRSKTEKPFLVLANYSDMEGLASDLERAVKDPEKVQRVDGHPPTIGRKMLRGFIFVGILGVMLLLGVGLIWVLAKIGLGPLILPLSFLAMGISNFASNRHNRQKRVLGIVMILGALVVAAIKIFALSHPN